MRSQMSSIGSEPKCLKHCVILTDYYRVEPQMAAQICGRPVSTALTVQQLSHLSRFGSIFNSDTIKTILNIDVLNYRITIAGKVPSIRTLESEITSQDKKDSDRILKTSRGKIRSNRAEMALYGPTETGPRYLIPTENQPVSLQVSS